MQAGCRPGAGRRAVALGARPGNWLVLLRSAGRAPSACVLQYQRGKHEQEATAMKVRTTIRAGMIPGKMGDLLGAIVGGIAG